MQIDSSVVRIRPARVDKDQTFSLYKWRTVPALLVVGTISTYVLMAPVLDPPEPISRDQMRAGFLHHTRFVADAVKSYTIKENNGIVPQFSTEYPPEWWSRYSPGQADPGVTFEVNPNAIGKRLNTLEPNTTLLIACGQKLKQWLPNSMVGIRANGYFNYFTR